jgi:hypothetical protein
MGYSIRSARSADFVFRYLLTAGSYAKAVAYKAPEQPLWNTVPYYYSPKIQPYKDYGTFKNCFFVPEAIWPPGFGPNPGGGLASGTHLLFHLKEHM